MTQRVPVDGVMVKGTEEMLIRVHEAIIKDSGGEQGIRDLGGFYHSTYKILRYREQHHDTPDIVAAFIYAEMARRHILLMETNEWRTFLLNSSYWK